MWRLVYATLLVFISAVEQMVMTNCQPTDRTEIDDPSTNNIDSRNDKLERLEQLLLETKSNFDEMWTEIQLLKDTTNNQLQVHRELIGNMTERMNNVTRQANELSRHENQELRQQLMSIMNTSTTTAIVKLAEQNSGIQSTGSRLEAIERMLREINATHQCKILDCYRGAMEEFNTSIQWMREGVGHLTTTCGRRKFVSCELTVALFAWTLFKLLCKQSLIFSEEYYNTIHKLYP